MTPAPDWRPWLLGAFLLGASAGAEAQAVPDFAQLVERQGAVVVNISASAEDGATAGDDTSLGSGLILSPDGYILTCAHLVDNAHAVRVRLRDRREYGARIIGTDRRTDIALLKIEARNLPRVAIGDPRRLRVGEWVLAIGSPFGFENSATAGIVSATGRALAGENYTSYIQTDVPINPGNSGGPLFNLAGEAVGINSQILSRRAGGFLGLSFAIPIDVAVRIAAQLKDYGYVRRGWLGVNLQEVTRDMADAYGLAQARGALVADLLPDGPAAKSGLRRGDIIVEYQGQPVGLSSELAPRVGMTRPGTAVRLGVIRRNQGRQTIVVALGELSEPGTVAARREGGAKPAAGLGLALSTPTAAHPAVQGVFVTAVGPGPARDAGLRTGDMIIEVEGRAVTTADEAVRLLQHASTDRPTVIRVQRGPTSVYLALRAGG